MDLIKAIKQNISEEELWEMIDTSKKLIIRDYWGCSVIYYIHDKFATYRRIVSVLLRAGYNANGYKFFDRLPPLSVLAPFAGKCQTEKYVRELIDYGARVNEKYIYAPYVNLHYVTRCVGHGSTAKTVQILLDAGSQIIVPDIRDPKMEKCNENVVKMQIEAEF